MHPIWLIAFDRIIELTCDENEPETLAARYTTMTLAAAAAKQVAISNIDRYAASTFARASGANPDDLRKQMTRWAAATRDKHELLAPICALLFTGARITPSGILTTEHLSGGDLLRNAASTLFGHEVLGCSQGSCLTCDAAQEGDWARALRTSAGKDFEAASAAMVDAYRAARRGGLIPAVTPHQQDGSNFAPLESEDKPVF